MESVDVAFVGGGPAGSTCAWRARDGEPHALEQAPSAGPAEEIAGLAHRSAVYIVRNRAEVVAEAEPIELLPNLTIGVARMGH
jgi:hypothetical protein